MDIKQIKKAPYNPRTMSRDSKKALKQSIEQFNDISGIVVNKTTGNLISGNHRWDQLCDIYGKTSLKLVELSEDLFSIHSAGKPTGFILRAVEWPLEKEKAANIAANSDLIMGEFTSGLQDILAELSEVPDISEMFESLRFDELSIDMDSLDKDLDIDDDIRDKIQKDAESNNRKLKDSKTREPEEVRIILDTIKISVPGEILEEVKEDIKKMLSKKYYKDDVKVLWL